MRTQWLWQLLFVLASPLTNTPFLIQKCKSKEPETFTECLKTHGGKVWEDDDGESVDIIPSACEAGRQSLQALQKQQSLGQLSEVWDDDGGSDDKWLAVDAVYWSFNEINEIMPKACWLHLISSR